MKREQCSDHKLGQDHQGVTKDVLLVDTVKPSRFQQTPKLQVEIRSTLWTATTRAKRPTALPMRGTATTQTTSPWAGNANVEILSSTLKRQIKLSTVTLYMNHCYFIVSFNPNNTLNLGVGLFLSLFYYYLKCVPSFQFTTQLT